ncbi:MAG: hypothetical protein ACREAS_06535 [Nitrososphaera sp.]
MIPDNEVWLMNGDKRVGKITVTDDSSYIAQDSLNALKEVMAQASPGVLNGTASAVANLHSEAVQKVAEYQRSVDEYGSILSVLESERQWRLTYHRTVCNTIQCKHAWGDLPPVPKDWNPEPLPKE